MSEKQKKLAFFLGCVIPNRYPMVETSIKRVFAEFDYELLDMKGAGCCPAPGVFRSFDIDTWLVLAARNISIAEELGTDIVTGCNGCYGTLLEANHILTHNVSKREKVNQHLGKIGKEFRGTIRVRHIIEVFYNDIGVQAVKDKIRYRLPLKVAAHAGCHLVKPAGIRPWGGKTENFTAFDELIESTGAESVDYNEKNMCCGAGGGLRSAMKEVALDFTREKLEGIRQAGADIICVCCPFCEMQFDLGQVEINTIFKDLNSSGQPFQIPVIYYTQLLGLALGINPHDLGLIVNHNLKSVPPYTPIDPFLHKLRRTLSKFGVILEEL